MAPSLANTPVSDSRQAARATPKGLAPPTECRPGKGPIFWPTDRKMPSRPEIWPVFWPTTKRMMPFRFTAEGHRAILT